MLPRGSSINSEGVEGADMWGKRAKWVDYWAPINDHTVGIAIFDHSKQPTASDLVARPILRTSRGESIRDS